MNYKKIFNTSIFCLFVIFLAIFGASKAGYYEYDNKKKAEFTSESMKQFEKDIKNGKNVNIKDYLKKDEKKYDNKITKLGNSMSEVVTKSIITGLEDIFKMTEKIIE